MNVQHLVGDNCLRIEKSAGQQGEKKEIEVARIIDARSSQRDAGTQQLRDCPRERPAALPIAAVAGPAKHDIWMRRFEIPIVTIAAETKHKRTNAIVEEARDALHRAHLGEIGCEKRNRRFAFTRGQGDPPARLPAPSSKRPAMDSVVIVPVIRAYPL